MVVEAGRLQSGCRRDVTDRATGEALLGEEFDAGLQHPALPEGEIGGGWKSGGVEVGAPPLGSAWRGNRREDGGTRHDVS